MSAPFTCQYCGRTQEQRVARLHQPEFCGHCGNLHEAICDWLKGAPRPRLFSLVLHAREKNDAIVVRGGAL